MSDPRAENKKLIEAASTAIERIFHHQGRVNPMYHCERADGIDFLMPATGNSKDEWVMNAKIAFLTQNVVRYVFIVEAWTLWSADVGAEKAKEGYEKLQQEGGSLEHVPGRREVVMLQAEDDNCMVIATRAIIRPKKGKARLGPLEYSPEFGSHEGRMVGLLPPKGVRSAFDAAMRGEKPAERPRAH